MTDKRRKILMITAILAVAVIAFSLLYSMIKDETSIYRDSIQRAEEAYAKGDYETAVLRYKEAVEADQNSVPAYEGLSNAYAASGNFEMARNTLWNGYTRTNSRRLYSLWFRFYDSHAASGGSSSEDSSVNHLLLTRLAAGTYRSYSNQAEPVWKELQNDGSLLIRFSEIPGIMVFRNSAFQPSAVSGTSISDDALPEEIHMDDISMLLGGKAPYTRANLEQRGASDLYVTREPQAGHAFRFTMDGCTVIVTCDENETIQEGAYCSVIPTDTLERMGNHEVSDRIRLTGEIIDAQTGKPVDDITLQFRAEGDETGEVLAVGVTGYDGGYEVDLPPGTYTVEMGGNGYISEFHSVEIGEDEIEAEEDFVVTRELEDGEARIVLEWGSTPTDLDSHLIGKTDIGTSFHIYYGDKTASDSNGTIVDLDLDDTSSYGPETTTIHNLNGKYEYYVHNFTPSTGTLEGSGAKVSLYLPGQPVRTFHVSEGTVNGDSWMVCTIDHGKIGTDFENGIVPAEPSEGKPGDEEPESPVPQEPEQQQELTMEDAGLPYGLYEGYKHNTGDGAIEVTLQLNEDMTYRLQCIFALFNQGERYDGDYYTYTGTYRVDRIDNDGRAVLSFDNSVQDFEMKQDELGLDCEYFSARYPG